MKILTMMTVACGGICLCWGKPARLEPTGVEVLRFAAGQNLFTDRPHFRVTAEAERQVKGWTYFRTSIEGGLEVRVQEDGELRALAAEEKSIVSQGAALKRAGFTRVPGIEPFQLFGTNACDRCEIWKKDVRRGETFRFAKWVLIAGFDPRNQRADVASGREILPNGIVLPKDWPPQNERPTTPARAREPMRVPYLEAENRPDPIWIDCGRQLFVDDFLIAETDLTRIYPKPVKYAGNPVLRPETKLELNRPRNACALPKGGGVWWDPAEGIYKLWYEAGWIHTICYATSKDGIRWDRPSLDVVPGTNQVLPPDLTPDSWSVVPDPEAADPMQRYKMFLRGPGGGEPGWALTSADGIHWTNRVRTGECFDRSSMFYNPFRRRWVFSLRGYWGAWGRDGVRSRHYHEAADFLSGAAWSWNPGASTKDCVIWAAPDRLDPEDPVTKFPVQLYSLDAVAYESILLGFYELHHGPENDVCMKKGLPKITDLVFAYSRDGFHWSRPDRAAAIASSRWGSEKWDTGYVQAAANLCVIVGDKLRFYYGAFRGDPKRLSGEWKENGMYDNGSMGFAELRRDGFVGLKAERAGSVTTHPVLFSGAHLFANVEAPEGELRAEVLDADGRPLPGFTAAECVPVRGDTVKARLAWRGRADLSGLRGRRVKFRFQVERGTLYSFWVSPRATGESNGHLAGGGPAYRSRVDR